MHPQQFLTWHSSHNLVGAIHNLIQQLLGQDQPLLLAFSFQFDSDVLDLGVNSQGHVAGQGPRRGGPHQEVGARLIPQGELDENGRVFDLFVAHSHLVIRQGGAAAGAIRYNLVALVDEVLIPQLLEDPPDRLDVFILQGDVGVVHVNPEADAVGQLLPFPDVAKDTLAALGVELSHAIVLDGLLAVEIQLLLDLQLHGKAMRIPAPLPEDMVATHGLVAGEEVFENPSQDVMSSRNPVCGGWPLIKHVSRRTLTNLQALLENLVLFPKTEDARLPLGKANFARYFFKHDSSFLLPYCLPPSPTRCPSSSRLPRRPG